MKCIISINENNKENNENNNIECNNEEDKRIMNTRLTANI